MTTANPEKNGSMRSGIDPRTVVSRRKKGRKKAQKGDKSK
jgi:hypothetical protein